MIAVWFSQNRGTGIEKRRKIISDIRNIPYQMQNALDNEEVCKHIASLLRENKSIFLLGKGRDEAIAKEGSLKLKEISYVHAEGYSTSSLKHGTFALIEENLPIIIIDITEEHRDKNRNAFQEVKARNAFIIRFTDMVDTKTEENDITIENNTTFSGLLVNTYIQLISYYMAILKGNNPDFPRNLAKVVTVE
jgi:glucosamine--fructose-6-phosphate aminotransferase (isomerizing)